MQINDKSMVCTHRFSSRVCANEGLMPTALGNIRPLTG